MKSSLLLLGRLFGQIRQRLLCCDRWRYISLSSISCRLQITLSLVYAAYFLFCNSDVIWYFSIPDFTNLVFFKRFGI